VAKIQSIQPAFQMPLGTMPLKNFFAAWPVRKHCLSATKTSLKQSRTSEFVYAMRGGGKEILGTCSAGLTFFVTFLGQAKKVKCPLLTDGYRLEKALKVADAL
jgi:hypothetical protein